jgi:hypothetical protein
MGVSKRDRAYMERLAASLRDIQRDDWGDRADRRALLAIVNERRRADGRDELADEDETRPEEGIYRRARALGMARTDR